MTDKAAGNRLKQAIHIARARANILYDTDLATRAGVSYDTLMNWFGGKTVPRGAELRRVGQLLGVSYADLMAAYEGREPEQPELTEILRTQIEAINALTDQVRELVEKQPSAREQAHALGQAVALAVREALRGEQRDGSPQHS